MAIAYNQLPTLNCHNNSLITNNPMVILFMIASLLLLAYYHRFWLIFIGSLVFSFLFLCLEICELLRIRKNINKRIKADRIQKNNTQLKLEVKKQMRSVGDQYNNQQAYKKEKNTEFSQNQLSKQTKFISFVTQLSSKILKLYQKKKSILPSNNNQNQVQANIQKNCLEIGTLQQKPAQLNKQQKQANTQLAFINLLIMKQIRQFVQVFVYSIFVLLVLGYNVVSIHRVGFLKNGSMFNIEDIVNQLKTRFTINYLVYLVPLMITNLWKFQRLIVYANEFYSLFFHKIQNPKNEGRTINFTASSLRRTKSLDQRIFIQQHSIVMTAESKSRQERISLDQTNLYKAKNASRTSIKEHKNHSEQQTNKQSPALASSSMFLSKSKTHEIVQSTQSNQIQIVMGLIQLQCTMQILVLFYLLVSFSIQIFEGLVYGPCLHKYFRNHCKQAFRLNFVEISQIIEISSSQTQDILFSLITNLLTFLTHRALLLIMYTSYIMLKYHHSNTKKPGMKQAIWNAHMIVDKTIKFFSVSLRKRYHRRVYRIISKLRKLGLIKAEDSKQQQNLGFVSSKEHKKQNFTDTILDYYQCI